MSPGAAPLRIMVVGPTLALPLRRTVAWALEEGHRVLLVDYQDHFPAMGRDDLHFARLLPRGAGRLQNLLDRANAGAWVSRLLAARLRTLAARFGADVVHLQKIDSRADIVVAAGFHPLVVSAWGSLNYLMDPYLQPSAPDRVGYLLAATDALLVESPALLAKSRALVRDSCRVALLPLGVDPDRFRPWDPLAVASLRDGYGIEREAVVLLSPRGWAELYGHHLIVEAFALAQPRFTRPAVLAFLGLARDRHADQYLRAVLVQAERLNVASSLRWLPELPHDEMPQVYAIADFVVNYPLTDAFPSTLLEAIACERPVITAALPGYQGTLIEDFCTAVAPGRPSALAEALVAAVNDSSNPSRTRLTQARSAAMSRYREADARRQLMHIYRELAA